MADLSPNAKAKADVARVPQEAEEPMYRPRDALSYAVRGGSITGAGGLFLAAVQNTVAKENIGLFGIFTKFGRTVTLFTAMGATYGFVSTASANLRERVDFWNQFWGGATAGSILGLFKRSAVSMAGNAMGLGVTLALIQYTGKGDFLGTPNRPSGKDPLEAREEIRNRFRRPVQETINEIGEGRGIYGPGYDERRKQRIKQNYGIEIQEPYYARQAAGHVPGEYEDTGLSRHGVTSHATGESMVPKAIQDVAPQSLEKALPETVHPTKGSSIHP